MPVIVWYKHESTLPLRSMLFSFPLSQSISLLAQADQLSLEPVNTFLAFLRKTFHFYIGITLFCTKRNLFPSFLNIMMLTGLPLYIKAMSVPNNGFPKTIEHH